MVKNIDMETAEQYLEYGITSDGIFVSVERAKQYAIRFAIGENNSIHKCKYCGAWTEQSDEYCYKNPNAKP